MSKKLGIKGHSTRGNEIIELLEMMGGSNVHNFSGCNNYAYYVIDSRQNIIRGSENISDNEDMQHFTLEEFLEKYPFKVGDIVKTGKDEEGVIKQMRWVDNDIVYWVNSHKTCDWTQTLSVDVLDKYNRLNLNDIEYSMETKIESTGFMQLGKTFAVIFNDANYEDEVELQLGDYEIEVRDGKTYAVKKKPKYPTTYEECCEKLGIEEDLWFVYEDIDGNHINSACISNYRIRGLELYHNLEKLKICRDAYWKIAGEEMGLDKPWEPDWKDNYQKKWTISFYQGEINFTKGPNVHRILAFPTEEMRDAFYENFKDLIESCKELL